MKRLKNYYATFGLDHVHANFYQPVLAIDRASAYKKVHELFGDKWAFLYDQDEWNASKGRGFFLDLKTFAPVICLDGIDVTYPKNEMGDIA